MEEIENCYDLLIVKESCSLNNSIYSLLIPHVGFCHRIRSALDHVSLAFAVVERLQISVTMFSQILISQTPSSVTLAHLSFVVLLDWWA